MSTIVTSIRHHIPFQCAESHIADTTDYTRYTHLSAHMMFIARLLVHMQRVTYKPVAPFDIPVPFASSTRDVQCWRNVRHRGLLAHQSNMYYHLGKTGEDIWRIVSHRISSMEGHQIKVADEPKMYGRFS